MDQDLPNEEGVIYCSFREIGIILPNKRYYKCIKPDICCDTGCCNEQTYKFGTVWQYWIIMLIAGIAIFGMIRYCCWLCKHKHAALNIRNTRPRSTVSPQSPIPHNAPPLIRSVIGGRRVRSSSNILHSGASVFSLGGHNSNHNNHSLTRLESNNLSHDDRISEALVHRDRYALNSLAGVRTPMGCQWGRRNIVPGVGSRIGRDTGGLTEDERLELGIRAIGGNTELTRDFDRIPTNNASDNGDLALLTQLMALDIIYHSDNNNNNPPNTSNVNEKPPDYEQCLNLSNSVKMTDVNNDTLLPTYEDICQREHMLSETPIVNEHCQPSVTCTVDVTDVNENCQSDDVRV